MPVLKAAKQTLKLNPNLAKTCKSATLAINERSKELINQGKTIFRLGLGQSPFPVPNCMVKALIDNAAIKDYLAVQGLLELRQEISRYLNRTESLSFDSSDIIVGPGTKELMYILQSVLNTDLLLPAPSWVSYQPQAQLCGLKTHWIPCSIDNDWKISASDLLNAIEQNPNAKLLILNSPNNPSGACFSLQELIDITNIVRQHNIIVLSDEIYSALNFNHEHQSLARYYPEGTIVSNGISKWSGAGGWRLGFMAIPKELKAVLEAMTIYASETYTSVSAPIQHAAIKAFEPSAEIDRYTHATRKIMQFVTQSFCEQIHEFDFICPKPEGGFYLLCQLQKQKELLLKNGISSSAMLCERLLNDVGVACLPGSDFGVAKTEFSIRFALVDFDGEKSLAEFYRLGASSLDKENPIYSRVFTAAEQIKSWINKL